MKSLMNIVFVGLFFCLGCKSKQLEKPREEKPGHTNATAESIKYDVDTKDITSDFRKWYNYTYRNILLSQDFKSINEKGDSISNSYFLDELAQGSWIAFKISKENSIPVYQLQKIDATMDKEIGKTMIQLAETEKMFRQYEGKQLPAFNFYDLDGKRYTPELTKGNIILLKCWFIKCLACVKEFPQLNNLVDTYKDRNDISFISLAMDPAEDLRKFLKEKLFQYKVVPNMEMYMSEKLQVTGYPTHFLIDKNGGIVKVAHTIEEIIPFLEKLLNRTSDRH